MLVPSLSRTGRYLPSTMMVRNLLRVRLFQETDPPPDLQSDSDFNLTDGGDRLKGMASPVTKTAETPCHQPTVH